MASELNMRTTEKLMPISSAVLSLENDNCWVQKQGSDRISSAFPVDTSDVLAELIDNYKKNNLPQEVSFRQLVPWMKVGERVTHYLHPYPAKLLPQIAHFFLAAQCLFEKSETILDPFAGSGTVAVETVLSGKNAYYSDSNPLARLITKVKTTQVSVDAIARATREVFTVYKKVRMSKVPGVVNINHWYAPGTISRLSRLKKSIDRVEDEDVRSFLEVTFSVTSRKVSLADPRLSVPVRSKYMDPKDVDVLSVFSQNILSNCQRMAAFNSQCQPMSRAVCTGNDARKLIQYDGEPLSDHSVDAIVTSPPYAGAQKYIRACSLNLGWLELASPQDLRPLEIANIGREHHPKSFYSQIHLTGIPSADEIISSVFCENQERAAIISAYLIEMRDALKEMYRVLKTGGFAVLIVGNNEVCGRSFCTAEYIEQICNDVGFYTLLKLIDTIKSRGLMTKRNKTASMITREWVLMFQK